MELGLTFPLQRFLKVKTPAYGTQPDRRFCWDLHVIELRGRKSLLAVHCHSRYTFVRYDVSPSSGRIFPGCSGRGFGRASLPPGSLRPGRRSICSGPGPFSSPAPTAAGR